MNVSLKKRNTNKSDLLSLHPGGIELTLHAAHAAGLSSGDEVLDIGCGNAASLIVLAEEFGTVPHGIDISPDVIASSFEVFPDMDLQCASAYKLPYADASFDAVICECVLTLLDDPEKALREALRVLKPGGILIISTLAAKESDSSSVSHKVPSSAAENRQIIKDGLIHPSELRTFLERNGAELVYSEDRQHDLTNYMIESIMEYGSLEERIKSDTEKTGTSVLGCGCRYDPHDTTYILQIFRRTSSCCYTQGQKQS